MGVKGLTAMLQRLTPRAINLHHISHYRGKTLAVDVSCFLNRFIYGLDPHAARVQRNVYRLCIYLHLHGIKPVFVFDGPERIVEKRREIERRNALKEKVERSFRLERIRKSRLNGLRGPAQLLQNLSPEQVSAILGNIRLRDDSQGLPSSLNSTPTTSTSYKLEMEGSDAITATKQHQKLMSDDDQLHLIQGLDPFEPLNIKEDDLANELSWHIPALSEDEQRQLEKHLQITRGFYVEHAPLSWTHTCEDDEYTVRSFEDDLDNLGLDLETVSGLDWIRDNMDTATGSAILDAYGALQAVVKTGTSVESVLSSEDLTQLDELEPSDPSYDSKIRHKIHEALATFVRTMERSTDETTEEFAQNSSRRQKALNELEQKLVQDIKEASWRNTLRKEISEPRPFTSGEPLVVSASSVSSASLSDMQDRVELFEAPELQKSTQSGEEASPFEIESERVEEEPLLEDMAEGETAETLMSESMDKDQTQKALGVTETVSEVDSVSEVSNETQQDPDLRSTIKEVLSVHKTLHMTLERRTLRVTWPLVLSCQSLLKAMGQPVIQANDAEAEAVCARLTTLGWADASVSEDTDTAVFGNGLLLRQVAFGSTKDIIEINPIVAHQDLGLSRDAFRDLCILCGTDFSGTIEGIGPHTAVKLIQQYGSIESIMANINNKPRGDFVYDKARRVFDRTPVVPQDADAYDTKPEIQPLLKELLIRYEIDPEEVRKELLSGASSEQLEAARTGGEGVFGGSFKSGSMGVDPFTASFYQYSPIKQS